MTTDKQELPNHIVNEAYRLLKWAADIFDENKMSPDNWRADFQLWEIHDYSAPDKAEDNKGKGDALRYKGLDHSFSDTLKCDVVWNGDGDALAGFYGGYDINGEYIDGGEEAKRFISTLSSPAPQVSREKQLMAALKECLNDYQAAYDVQAVVSSVTGKNNAERMAAGVRCDTILMPRIAKLRSLLGDEAQAQKGGS